ncbi:2-isopropylmalate synthase [Oceanispirochaeta crateris]|uniref:2-isopropylmalate synthase n=1 Tax=Oceanispirochaeta crateris TaxID=2518645 RepID=A0A5C1QQ77_9SPIO|nr:2-isopropylmalate synthase [Oceanispirochaeta crateris]QEN08736.1 2-isopropylmalate synthase [Oceanispirochaeta crateris]
MKDKYYKENSWWVSPFNYIDEVQKTLSIPNEVIIHDATLRDGEQTPGIVFRKDDKVRIAEQLDSIGIERIEAGMPAVSKEDFEAIKEISKRVKNAQIFTFARAMKSDIDMAVDCGAHGVVIEVPIGYPKLKYQFNWTWEDVYNKSADVINYAKEKGLYAVFFPYDTTRAREEDYDNLIQKICKNALPDSIGIVDTMGCATPEAIRYLVKKTKEMSKLPIEIHTHNDFGMGVATELAAVTAGASVVHSCVNGMGERTGNAALEDLILCLKLLYGVDNHYDIHKLTALCEYLSELTGIPIPRNKPVTGKFNYTRESGIGVDLVMKKPLAMFSIDPQMLGKTGDVALGKKSGRMSVVYTLESLGIVDVDGGTVDLILQEVKKMGAEKRRLLNINEFKAIMSDYGLHSPQS